MTRKHILPLTYLPKIPAVLEGRCTQTIRTGWKFQVGDLVMFHGWEGRPYRSKWSFRTPYWEIQKTIDITLHPAGFEITSESEPSVLIPWMSLTMDKIARMDGIDSLVNPGIHLRNILIRLNSFKKEWGTEMQIIRWRWTP